MKNRMVIFVPANFLRTINVNRAASISSLTVLRAPRLDLLVNGACDFRVRTIGYVNIIDNDKFEVEVEQRQIQIPPGMLLNLVN